MLEEFKHTHRHSGEFIASNTTEDFRQVLFKGFEVMEGDLEVGDFQLETEVFGQ